MSSVRVCLDVEAKGEGKVGYDQQVVVCSCSGKVEVHVSDARLLILQGDAASDIPNVVAGCIAESDQGGGFISNYYATESLPPASAGL